MITDTSTSIKHAFVTGATGIVGIPLCRQLVGLGAQVTSYSRSIAPDVLPEGVVHVSGDILDEDYLLSAAAGADVIFHVAAAVHGVVSTPNDFHRMNVDGTKSVIRAAQMTGGKLVHVSTVNVDGYRQNELSDPYAESKSRAEELVLEAADDGLSAVIVRPATVFGNEIGLAGLIVDRLLSGSLKVLPAGGRKISPVWSSDLATALVRAGEIGIKGRTYTVAGKAVSTGEFVREVCASADLRAPLLSPSAWLFVLPLQIAWWFKGVTRWTPPISVESLLNGSSHDGSAAATELGFTYTGIGEIFSGR
jgi:nucleoside-diphosphate-sugar epimerase